MSLAFLRALRRDRFFQLLIIVGMALSLFVPFAPRAWPDAIDWHTIITLSGLMLLTKGVELSGWVYCAGAQGDSQRGLDAAAGIYGDVY